MLLIINLVKNVTRNLLIGTLGLVAIGCEDINALLSDGPYGNTYQCGKISLKLAYDGRNEYLVIIENSEVKTETVEINRMQYAYPFEFNEVRYILFKDTALKPYDRQVFLYNPSSKPAWTSCKMTGFIIS